MSNDDLIGYEFLTIGGGKSETVRVTGESDIPGYVEVDVGGKKSVRQAGHVREHKKRREALTALTRESEETEGGYQ